MRKIILIIASIALSLSLVSCGGSGGGGGGGNESPISNAGSDQQVFINQSVLLDGSSSYDPDGDSISYDWSYVSGPSASVQVSNFGTATPSVFPDQPGTYVFSLIVNDGGKASTPDNVTIVVINRIPVANAGPDDTISIGAVAALDGSNSSDDDGQTLTYQWNLNSSPNGIPVTLSGLNTDNVSFTPVMGGEYLVELIVNDGFDNSVPDNVTVNVTEPVKTVVSTSVELEPNNLSMSADPVADSDTFTGQLSSEYDLDWYKLDVLSGGEVTLIIDATAGSVSTLVRYIVKVFDPTGQLISSMNIYGGLSVETLAFGVASTGTYYIKISSGVHYKSENYYITATYSNDPSSDVEVEPNNQQSASNAIYDGITMNGQLFDDSDLDWYQLAVSAGDAITLSVDTDANYTSFPRYIMTVRNESGVVVASTNLYAILAQESLVFGAAYTGTYYITLSPGSSYASEMYSITPSIN